MWNKQPESMEKSKKHLKINRDRLRQIADAMPALIAYVDSENRYVFCNVAYTEWFGLAVYDVKGVNVREVFDETTYRIMQPHIKKVLAGEKNDFEIQLNHRLKGHRINNTSLIPHKIDTGEVVGYYVLSTDITNIKRNEAYAEAKSKELSKVLEKIKRSNQELEQFASACSHNLEEPLRMIKGYINLLQKRYARLYNEKAATYFHYIDRGTQRMEELIQGLLDYARLEDPAGITRQVNLQEILDRALENLEQVIRENSASITSDPLPQVMGYDIQLTQLFQNLLANSIEFRRDDPPRISIRAEKKDNTWQIGISDNGIGISRKHGDKIFTIFHRLQREQNSPGTGVGLAICKKIVENHGGRIRFENNRGHGTTFYFTLPATENF